MEFFNQYIFPTLILGSFAGSLLYLVCSRMVYDYLCDHYHDALPEKGTPLQDNDEGWFVVALWYVTRTNGHKRIQSNTWRGFYMLTRVLGAFTGACLVLLTASFFFWTELKALLA